MRDVEHDQDGDDPEPERRRCDSRDGDRTYHMIDPAVLLQGRDSAERDRDEDGDHGRHHGDLERDRQARCNLFGDGLARPHRDPEIEAKEAPYEIQKLENQRTIESKLGVTNRDGARIDASTAGAETDHADVAGNETHQHKHERRRPDQGGDQEQHPVHDVPVHRGVRSRSRRDTRQRLTMGIPWGWSRPTCRATRWPSPD